MVSDSQAKKSKTFFLNEKQELSRFDREGGGRPADYVAINWSARSQTLVSSFRAATSPPIRTLDPTSSGHFFVMAIPSVVVEKKTTSKAIPGGVRRETPRFGAEQSRLFRKLGMDLIETLPDGKATVHVLATRASQIQSTMSSLPGASPRERARWINFEAFASLDWTSRVSATWLEELPLTSSIETVIRFQPTLRRYSVREVLGVLGKSLSERKIRLLKTGREFSGRYWCLAHLTKDAILWIAKEFSSVQSLHQPIRSSVMGTKKSIFLPGSNGFSTLGSVPNEMSVSDLPTVAVVDCGIPENHVHLGQFRRAGYRNPDLDPRILFMGNHASQVASCVVFGRVRLTKPGLSEVPQGSCRVLDVMVGQTADEVEDEIVVPAMETIVATSPDVRVFNLSFGGYAPLSVLEPIYRRESLMKLQDLDNFAFARDVLLVIAAGNSLPGLVPNKPYPNHRGDTRWHLGSVACSFNGTVCGAFVDVISDVGVAGSNGVAGAPSPLTRVGPGLCHACVPGFSAPGGDLNENYRRAPDTGPWTSDANGEWEDGVGTSFAAPLVAREAAWIFAELYKKCGGMTIPFAGTVKAYMNLVARRPLLLGAYESLAEVTLGKGFPTAQRLRAPLAGSVVFLWQTLLEMPQGVSRVQFPIPLVWIREATSPHLRVVCAWNTPVNIALANSWACRKVLLKIRPFGGSDALRGGGQSRGGYPLIDRDWEISLDALAKAGCEPSDDLWVLEVEYEEIGEYPPAMTVSPQQRVGVALEVYDNSQAPVSPQLAVQSLPLASELIRLSILDQRIETPITVQP